MDCDWGDYDGDAPEFFVEYNRKARKQHKCCECGRIIERGQKYLLSVGKWEGALDTFKTCFVCERIINDIFPDKRPHFTELRQTMQDCFNFCQNDDPTDEGCEDCPNSKNGEPCGLFETCKSGQEWTVRCNAEEIKNCQEGR